MKLLSRMLHPLLSVFLTLSGIHVASAAEPPSVSFRAVCFDPRETETPVFFVTNGAARDPMELDKSRLSGAMKANVRDGRLVDLYTSKAPTNGEIPAATATLPINSFDNLLFVIAPAGTGYRAWAIQLPPAELKPGSTLMINTAPAEVAIRLGGAKPVVVQPASSGILSLPEGISEPMVPIQIFERQDKSQPWQIAQSTRWPVDLRFRSYVFFYHSPTTEKLMLHGVTERMESSETARK